MEQILEKNENLGKKINFWKKNQNFVKNHALAWQNFLILNRNWPKIDLIDLNSNRGKKTIPK